MELQKIYDIYATEMMFASEWEHKKVKHGRKD
jgi:hypothetical protein